MLLLGSGSAACFTRFCPALLVREDHAPRFLSGTGWGRLRPSLRFACPGATLFRIGCGAPTAHPHGLRFFGRAYTVGPSVRCLLREFSAADEQYLILAPSLTFSTDPNGIHHES
jgi:hypothetical protein